MKMVCYDPRRVTKGQVVVDNTLQVGDKGMQRIARARPMFRFTQDEVDNARHYGTVFVYSNGAVNDLLRTAPMNQFVFTTSAQ